VTFTAGPGANIGGLSAPWGHKMVRMTLATPVLHTARLRLRPFTEADADSLFALHSSTHT